MLDSCDLIQERSRTLCKQFLAESRISGSLLNVLSMYKVFVEYAWHLQRSRTDAYLTYGPDQKYFLVETPSVPLATE